MYKIYSDLTDGSKHVFYKNENIPHLWLLAMDGQKSVAKETFCDNLIEIASKFNDDLLSAEVAQCINVLNGIESAMVTVEGNYVAPSIEALKQDVNDYKYEEIFGILVNKQEFYATSESKAYFKEHQKRYRRQYQSLTTILIIVNVVIFALNYIFGYNSLQYIISGQEFGIDALISILFAGFTHLSIYHIFFNMMFLQSIGTSVEQYLGKTKFLILYFGSLFISGFAVVLFSPVNTLTAGASGALYGLFTFFICLIFKHNVNPIARRNVLVSFAINIIFTFFFAGISVAGHLGGAIAGLIFYVIFNFIKK